MKINKKYLSLVLVFVLSLTLLAGCTSDTTDEETPAADNGKIKIALLMGTLGDKGFNDEVYKGLTDAEKDFDIEYDYAEVIENSEIETQLRNFADSEEYDLIIASNATYADTLKEIANDYPDQKFTLADSVIEGFDNIHSVRAFDPEQTFLSGAIAALTTLDPEMELANPDNVIAFIGGQDTPISRSGAAGFMAGAKYVNPDVEIIYNIVGDYRDPGTAKELAMTAYGRGADVISHNAGGSGLGVFNAAEESNKYVIGSSKATIDANRSLVTSIKRIDLLIYQEVEDIVNGEWKSGTTIKGLKEEVTGFDREGIDTKISDSILEKVEQVKQDYIDGKFELPTDPNEIEEWSKNNKFGN